MFARVTTVAFEGIEARPIDVQVQIGPGMPHFTANALGKGLICPHDSGAEAAWQLPT
jgi:hypothetical protein